MTDQTSLDAAVRIAKPNEVYNLAAMSYVGASWTNPTYTMDVNATGFIRLLEAIRNHGDPFVRVYQASSSEQFGKVQETPQTETTKFYPRSIYGVSKCAAHYAGVNYRESYDMHISMGICFNHESARRGLDFLSRKVSYGVAKIKLGLADHIELGNLSSARDWGHAPDYVEGMWMMLQQDAPDDYVMATGETHTVSEFVVEAFKVVGIENWQDYVKINPKYMRAAEVDYLRGNAFKISEKLGWYPKTSFKELVRIMVTTDLERLERGDRFE
jgi:GDPmannose 4,6-dehydratase